MTKRQQKIVDYSVGILAIVLLGMVVAIVSSSGTGVKNEGGIKKAIIGAGREVKDIVHEIQKD
jgi:hypothetical protein